MKNLLISVITLLIIVLTVITMAKGISIGNFQLLSIGQIVERNKIINDKVELVNQLNNVTYKHTLSDLNDNTKTMLEAKSKYLELASTSSNEEIKSANQEEAYSREYLWSRIGNHATANGINLKMDVTSTGISNKNILNFTVTGSYIGIRNFIYSLENDKILNFTIESFKLVAGANSDNLICTFLVSDVGIKAEQVSTTDVNSSSSQSNTTNTQNTTNTTSSTTKIEETKDIAGNKIDGAVSQ